MFLFLIFSMICIQIAIGGEGRGGEGSSRSGRQREFKGQGSASGHDRGHDGVHPFSFDPNEAKQYKIGIYTRRYNEDGTVGKVHFLQDYVLGVAKGANMPITDLVQLIANWEKRENGETIWAVNGVITRDTIFEPLLDGHVMAQFYNENNREEFRR
uniref:Uncharacterized protein n=1 Tax=Meloidogyne hapla TaxID=6305 RepID=A0A1I8BQ55_MELHA